MYWKRFLLVGLIVFLPWMGSDSPLAKEFNARKADRYVKILLRRPTNKYLFEKVYSMYAGAGKIDLLLKNLKKAAKDDKTGASHIVMAKIYRQQQNLDKTLFHLNEAVKLKPKSYSLLLLLGKSYAAAHKYPKAIEVLQKCLTMARTPKGKRDILETLGQLYIEVNQRNKAKETWDQIRKVGGLNSIVLRNLINLYEKNKFYKTAIELITEVIRRSPHDLRLKYRMKHKLATLYQSLGNFHEADKHFREVIRDTSQGHWIRAKAVNGLFQLYQQNQKLDQLVDHYRKEIGKDPKEVENYILLARAYRLDPIYRVEKYASFLEKTCIVKFENNHSFYQMLADYYGTNPPVADPLSKHVFYLKKLYQLKPNRHDLMIKVCKAYLQHDLFPPARLEAKAFLKKHPQSAYLHYQVARVFNDYQRREEAIEIMTPALRLPTATSRMFVFTGKLYFKLKREKDALAIWKNLAPKGTKDDFAVYRLAQLLDEHKLYKEALAEVERALDMNPKNFNYLLFKAACHNNLEQYTKAVEAFKMAKAQAKTVQQEARARKLLVEVYQKSPTERKKIIKNLELAKKENPNDPDILETLAELYRRTNRQSEAIQLMEKLLEMRPKHLYTRKKLAEFYSQSNKKAMMEKSIEQYLKLVELNPTQKAEYLLQIGILYRTKLQNKTRALEYFAKARKAESRQARVYYNLALQYQSLNRADLHREMLKLAVQYDSAMAQYHFALAEAYIKAKEFDNALKHHFQVIQINNPPSLTQESLKRFYQHTIAQARNHVRKKAYRKAERLYEKCFAPQLKERWTPQQAATLHCKFIQLHIEHLQGPPSVVMTKMQEVITRYKDSQVMLDEGHSLDSYLWCWDNYWKMDEKYRDYYEKKYGALAKNDLEMAAQADDKATKLRQVIKTYPLSVYAGRASLQLGDYLKESDDVQNKVEASYCYEQIVHRKVAADKETLEKACVQYLAVKKKLGEGREAFEDIREYASKSKALSTLVAKNKKLYPDAQLARIAHPLSIKWKHKVDNENFSAPVFSRGKIYYRDKDDTLLVYDLQDPNQQQLMALKKTVEPRKVTIPANSLANGNYRYRSRYRHYRFFGSEIYRKDLYLYGGPKLVAYNLQKNKVAWTIPKIKDSLKIVYDDINGDPKTLDKARLLKIDQDFYYLKYKGKGVMIPRSRIRSTDQNSGKVTKNTLEIKIKKLNQKLNALRRAIRNKPEETKNLLEYQKTWKELYKAKNQLSQSRRYSRQTRVESLYLQPFVYKNKIFIYEAVQKWLVCLQPNRPKPIRGGDSLYRIQWAIRLDLDQSFIVQPNSYTFSYQIQRLHPRIQFIGDNIYILADKLYCYDINTAKKVWQRKLGLSSNVRRSRYRNQPPSVSFLALGKRLYISTIDYKILVYDPQGRKVLERPLPRRQIAMLNGRNNILVALSDDQLTMWRGQDLNSLKNPTSIKLDDLLLSGAYYTGGPTPLAITSGYFYLATTSSIRAFTYTGGSLRMGWRNDKLTKETTRSSVRYPAYRRYRRTSSTRHRVMWSYVYRNSLYVLSPYSGNLYSFKSWKDREAEILARIQQSPQLFSQHFELATLYREANKTKQAVTAYKKVLQLAPPRSPMLDKSKVALYEIYFQEGQKSQEANQFTQALTSFKNAFSYASTSNQKGHIALRLSWIFDLKFSYSERNLVYPLSAGVAKVALGVGGNQAFHNLYNLAYPVKGKLKTDLEQTFLYYRQALQQFPNLVIKPRRKSEEAIELGPFVAAQLERILQNPQAWNIYQNFAGPKARSALKKALTPQAMMEVADHYPYTNAAGRAMLGAAQKWTQEMGEPEKAIPVLLRLRSQLEKRPNFSSVSMVDAIWNLGHAYYAHEDYSSALNQYMILEHQYLRRGKLLPFDRQLARALVQSEELLQRRRDITPPWQRQWRFQLRQHHSGNYGFHMEVAAASGKLFYLLRSSGIRILDPKTGRDKGVRIRVSGLSSQSYDRHWTSYRLVSTGNMVMTYGRGNVYGIDGERERLAWTFTDMSISTEDRNDIEYYLQAQAQTVYALASHGYLYALDAKTGQLKWKRKVSDKGFKINTSSSSSSLRYGSSSFQYSDRYPLFLVDGDYLYLVGEHIRALSTNSGLEQWNYTLTQLTQKFSTHTGKVYRGVASQGILCITDTQGRIMGIDGSRGQIRWKNWTGTGNRTEIAVGQDKVVTVARKNKDTMVMDVIDIHRGKKIAVALELAVKEKTVNYSQYSSSYSYRRNRNRLIPQIQVSPSHIFINYHRIYAYNANEFTEHKTGVKNETVVTQKAVLQWRSPFVLTSSRERFICPPLYRDGRCYIMGTNGYYYGYERQKR